MGSIIENHTLLPENKIHFSLKSMVDDFGRVFFKDGKVFRAIQSGKEENCFNLIHSDLFKELTDKGFLPKTEVANFKIDGHDLVLEHEKLLEILQHEWSFDMLKDAALMIFEINEVCNKYGYELKDAHTLNVLFRGVNPVMVDIGSISKKENMENTRWKAYEEYLGSFVIPLMFWSKKMNYISRKLLESNFHKMYTLPVQTIPHSGLMTLLAENTDEYQFKLRGKLISTQTEKSTFLKKFTEKTQSIIKTVTGRNTQIFTYKNITKPKDFLRDYFPMDQIKLRIKNIEAPEQNTTWKGYHQKYYSGNEKPHYSPRFLRLLDLIKTKEEEIGSVIDLAGNEGYFCNLLNEETNIKNIILADYDENAINTAFNFFKEKENNRVHTVLLNFMFTPDLKGTFKRLKSDLVVALAVTHHLILTGNFSIKTIFERLREFSNNYVMVEFMPLGLWGIDDEIYPKLPEWYNIDWFRKEFEIYFKLIHEEQLEKNRILFFGKLHE